MTDRCRPRSGSKRKARGSPKPCAASLSLKQVELNLKPLHCRSSLPGQCRPRGMSLDDEPGWEREAPLPRVFPDCREFSSAQFPNPTTGLLPHWPTLRRRRFEAGGKGAPPHGAPAEGLEHERPLQIFGPPGNGPRLDVRRVSERPLQGGPHPLHLVPKEGGALSSGGWHVKESWLAGSRRWSRRRARPCSLRVCECTLIQGTGVEAHRRSRGHQPKAPAMPPCPFIGHSRAGRWRSDVLEESELVLYQPTGAVLKKGGDGRQGFPHGPRCVELRRYRAAALGHDAAEGPLLLLEPGHVAACRFRSNEEHRRSAGASTARTFEKLPRAAVDSDHILGPAGDRNSHQVGGASAPGGRGGDARNVDASRWKVGGLRGLVCRARVLQTKEGKHRDVEALERCERWSVQFHDARAVAEHPESVDPEPENIPCGGGRTMSTTSLARRAVP